MLLVNVKFKYTCKVLFLVFNCLTMFVDVLSIIVYIVLFFLNFKLRLFDDPGLQHKSRLILFISLLKLRFFMYL